MRYQGAGCSILKRKSSSCTIQKYIVTELKLIIALLSLTFAVQGYLFQINRDSSKPNSFKNLNTWGKIFLLFTIIFACLNFWVDYKSSEKQEKEIKEKDAIMRSMHDSLMNKINCSSMLYVTVKGVLHFEFMTKGTTIQDGFKNLFNDLASISVTITQDGKKYTGSIDEYTPNINFKRCRRIDEETFPPDKAYLATMNKGNSQYIEVACPLQLRDDNEECFLISDFPSLESIEVNVTAKKNSTSRLYKYREFYANEIVFKNYNNLSDSIGKSIYPASR